MTAFSKKTAEKRGVFFDACAYAPSERSSHRPAVPRLSLSFLPGYHVRAQVQVVLLTATKRYRPSASPQPASSDKRHMPQILGSTAKSAPPFRDSVPLNAVFWAEKCAAPRSSGSKQPPPGLCARTTAPPPRPDTYAGKLGRGCWCDFAEGDEKGGAARDNLLAKRGEGRSDEQEGFGYQDSAC